MKTLIVYYSYTENNEKLALLLQKKLGCDLLKIEELKARTKSTIFFDWIFNRLPPIKTSPHNLKDYQQIIFVAPVWAARIATPLKTFIVSERKNFVHYAFITVCGGGQKDQEEKITRQLAELTGVEPEAVTQLSLNDLFTRSREKDTNHAVDYRLQDSDFSFYDEQITQFLTTGAMPLARGWQVKYEYGD